MRAIRSIGFLTLLAVQLVHRDASAAISGLTRVASGLSSPIFMTCAPGDRSRLFIVQRGGTIRILDLNTGTLEPTAFLSIPGVITTGEGGLLGMAFDPNYQTNGKFYVDLTADDSDPNTVFSTYIRQYTVSSNPDIADPSSAKAVLSFGQPQSNHDAGWIGFSPNDGYLYVSAGDGGGGNDNSSGHTVGIGNGQDKSVLLAKMVRVDVSGDDFPADPNRNYKIPSTNPFVGVSGAAPEVWAYGLRNPFRDSFDRVTGDLWIGDVGQDNREEIDFQPAGSTGGANYGWRLREGDIATPTPLPPGTPVGGDPPADYVAPVYTYTHPDTTVPPVSPGGYSGKVVTGGYVYRGPDPSLQGKYFFFDSQNTSATSDDNYWMFDPSDPTGTVANINSLLTANTGSHQFPASFGEDAVGNLYIAYLISGEVYKLATNQFLAGDYDQDGDVDNTDYTVWRSTFGTSTGSLAADGNHNGVVDAADYLIWRKNLGASVHAGAGTVVSAVPEPTSIVCALEFAAITVIATVRWRRPLARISG
jgi:glucose/arabinose dehydrogenase